MKCATCGVEIDPTNSFCECGASLPDFFPKPPTAKKPDGAPLAEQMKRCPFCSEEILATATKCKHCGSILTTANEPPAEEVSLKPLWNALKIIFAIVVAIIAGVLWYTKTQKSCDEKYRECQAEAIGWAGKGLCDMNYSRCKGGQKEIR